MGTKEQEQHLFLWFCPYAHVGGYSTGKGKQPGCKVCTDVQDNSAGDSSVQLPSKISKRPSSLVWFSAAVGGLALSGLVEVAFREEKLFSEPPKFS